MMLETEISKLTEQVIRLNELLAALLSSKSDAPVAPSPVVSVSDAALVSAAVKLESAVASAPVASAPVASAPVASAPVASAPVAPAPVAPAPVAPAPVAPAPVEPAAITLETLRQLCVAKAKKDYANSGRIRGILAPYSVTNIQGLKPEDYSAVYAAVEAL